MYRGRWRAASVTRHPHAPTHPQTREVSLREGNSQPRAGGRDKMVVEAQGGAEACFLLLILRSGRG